MEKEIVLETKLVGNITGTFTVPSYQRGYRWGVEEVVRLLDDIYANGNKNYCLQPVVVRKCAEGFELIDGQQRLTTLFILLQYIKKEYKHKINLKFTLNYQIRKRSAEYLSNIDESQAEDNIDFAHIYRAYQAIDQWFQSQSDDVVAADDLYGYLIKYVKVIWYEVGESEDAISLFTRLNIGKIPLTSAELVKAMFLSRDGTEQIDRKKQDEIALQWDNMEKELHREGLWYFLTNRYAEQYQTRIDLVLNLIAGNQENNREKYDTFFVFDKMRHENDLDLIWRRIQRTFLTLKDWYENHELYHKIGYLIASGAQSLQEIYDAYTGKTQSESDAGMTKDKFRTLLDELIKKSIAIPNNYAELTYETSVGYQRISRLLLLFNIESVRKIGEQTQWFPFDKFKYGKNGKVSWSLEHIHAQHSEGLHTQEMWKEWLRLHIPSVRGIGGDHAELLSVMEKAIDNPELDGEEFVTLQKSVVELLSVAGNTEYLHRISNLALLNSGDNAALNNSTFDVKRNRILEMDKAGQYIPFCTRMVFMKYYTPSDQNQLHFWGQADRIAYVRRINEVLKNYLPEPITLEMEEP